MWMDGTQQLTGTTITVQIIILSGRWASTLNYTKLYFRFMGQFHFWKLQGKIKFH